MLRPLVFLAVDDIRWFAPNAFCALPVPGLRGAGLRVATVGDSPARVAFLSDATSLREAVGFAWRHGASLIANIWDVQPWQVAGGHPDHVGRVRSRLMVVPRLGTRYPGRPRYYSRVHYVARHAKEVWAPSRFSQAELERWTGRAAEHVPFCFDSTRFNRSAGWQRPAGTPVILSVSRLAPHKNHAAVIRAAALIAAGPRVRIVGRGSEGANLRALATRLGVELRLDETWLSDRQIVDAYLGARVVVCPSRFEGIGITPLEGVAMGIPTVASDIPPHREFATGQAELVPLDDDRAMAAAIDRALGQGDAPVPALGAPVAAMTIEACVARILPRLERLLRRVSSPPERS